MASTRLPHGFNMSVLHACQYVVASELNTKLNLLTVLISIDNSKLLCEMQVATLSGIRFARQCLYEPL